MELNRGSVLPVKGWFLSAECLTSTFFFFLIVILGLFIDRLNLGNIITSEKVVAINKPGYIFLNT